MMMMMMTSDRSKRIAVAGMLWWLLATLTLGLQLVQASEQQQEQGQDVEDDPIEYGLPDHTEPESYELSVKPAIDHVNGSYTFSGHVDIVILAVRYTTEVVLNSKDLAITSVSGFEDVKNGRYIVPVESFECDEPREQLVVALARSLLPTRRYRFTVHFNGILRDDFTGLHKYFYDHADESRWIALTQFKPIYARRAFPCYDEPKFKTPFKISIARRVKHFSLSNMPLIVTEINRRSGWAWDHFETTKPIPTFLVAFMVSDFNKNTLNDDSIAMYTRKEFIERTSYMMGKAPRLLEGVEKFTQIQYMLPKLDLVGVPLLDASYSMENWGLNSYEEFYVTLSNSSETEDKISGTMTVLHAILHQWFGNMVTTPSWDYMWLNEGICNYLNYYITNTIEPEWDLHLKFVENVHQRALTWDQYDDVNPLTFPLLTPEEIISRGFDAITSDKSASLFRMLNYMVGDSYFKMSLNKYLDDFAYAEAGPKELWNAFDNVLYDNDIDIDDGITVDQCMRLWTDQAGYPLINVRSTDNGSAVIVTQERFSLSIPRRTDRAKWFVGLTYTTEKSGDFDQVTPTVWLKPEDEHKVIPVPVDSGWMVFNIQSIGFYRVNYDEKNWKLLLIQLITEPHSIHVLNRAQIVNDACHLSRAGVVPYDYYISLLEYLLMEDHVVPWNSAVDGLSSTMDGLRRYPAEHQKFQEYANGLAGILYDKLAANKIDNESTKIGWSKLFAWTCKLGNSRCQELALEHFDAWTSGHGLPSEMEEAALCEGMKRGGFTAWSKVYKFYKAAQSQSRRQIVLRALACAENVQTLFNHLNPLQLEGAGQVSAKNFKTVFENIATTPQGVRTLTDFLSHKLDVILALNDGHQLATFAYSVLASKVVTDDEIKTMNKLRASVNSADLKTALDEKHGKIESNLKWISRDHKKIMKAIGK